MDIIQLPEDIRKKQLGEFAFKRLQILDAMKAQVHVDSLKEQLREIDKQMAILGWDGKKHKVIMTGDGPRLKKITEKPKISSIIIIVKPFQVNAFVNKYL